MNQYDVESRLWQGVIAVLLIAIVTIAVLGMLKVTNSSLLSPTVTFDEYKQLKTGMSLQQVNEVIGKPGTFTGGGSMDLLGDQFTAECYEWTNSDGKELTVGLANGKVVGIGWGYPETKGDE